MPRETRLDKLTRLLHPATYTHDQLIRALRQAAQDVPGAAELLLTGAVAKPQPDIQVVCIDDSDDQERTTAPCKKRKVMDSAGFMARLTANQEKTTPTRKTGEKPIHLKSIFTDEKETTLTYAQLPTLTLHRSPIPAPLASALFQELMSEAESYERHEWFLAGRKVQSPHTSGYYHDGQLEAEDSAAGEGYWYAGKQVNPAPRYPPLLGQAAALITPYVNNVLVRRSRLAGEYAGGMAREFCRCESLSRSSKQRRLARGSIDLYAHQVLLPHHYSADNRYPCSRSRTVRDNRLTLPRDTTRIPSPSCPTPFFSHNRRPR